MDDHQVGGSTTSLTYRMVYLTGNQLPVGTRDQHRCHLEDRLSSLGKSSLCERTRYANTAHRPQFGTLLGAVYAYVVRMTTIRRRSCSSQAQAHVVVDRPQSSARLTLMGLWLSSL